MRLSYWAASKQQLGSLTSEKNRLYIFIWDYSKVLQGPWAEKRGRMSKSNEYRRVAASMAERYGVDPELYVRLVERESGFDPTRGS